MPFNNKSSKNQRLGKTFDSKRTGRRTRVLSTLRINEGGRAREAPVKIKDSKSINCAHPEAECLAVKLLKK